MEVRISKVVSQILSDHLPAYGLNEIVAEFVEEEVQGKLTQVLESISKKHQIPLDILLHDVPGLRDDQRCRGYKTTKDGSRVRCSFKASQNGYCKFHEHQGDNIESRRLSSGGANGHNHGPERMNVAGCPACERGRKGLIDLNTLVFNQ
jgi:hypothetical protein|tara:strand:+ start:307 stop:753 length:447 start_codon:yes stop_codon:yes gene_type:complete